MTILAHYSLSIYTLHRGAWKRDGMPVTGLELKQAIAARDKARLAKACTHQGPCRFPFKQCDGGAVTIIEKE